jgi:HEAT repeat protein
MLQVPTLLALCLLLPCREPAQDPEVADPPLVDRAQDPALDPLDPDQDPVVDPAQAEQAEVERRLARREWVKLMRRDSGVGFTDRTRQAAQSALSDTDTVGIARACAFFALGSVQSVAARPALELEAREAPGIVRRAAVLALGELGESLNGAAELLIELLEDPDPSIVNDALLALARSHFPRAETHLKRLVSDTPNPLSQRAQQALDFVRFPNRRSEFESVTMLLSLRYETAKRYGSLNGRPWSQHRLEELKRDEAFLDEVILMAAAELLKPGIKDHLMEIVIQPGRTLRWRAAATALPEDVERMIANGLGGPHREAGWAQLIDGAVESGWAGSMPETLGKALSIRALAPTAAAHLIRSRPDLEEELRAAFRSPRREVRVRAAEAVGRLSLTGYLLDLRGLSKHTFTAGGSQPHRIQVAAASWVARLRLGDLTAREPMIDVLADRVGAYNDHDRSGVLDALEKACLSEAVVQFLVQLAPLTDGLVRAEVQALLALSGRAPASAGLRAAYGEADRGSSSAGRLLRGIAHLPSVDDLEFLAREFPLDEDHASNVLLAQVLIENGHEKIEPILRAAIWKGPWHRSALAAAVVAEYRGLDLLMHWVAMPPATARSVDLRRVGFAIGEWGGLEAIDKLRRLLGSAAGAERPALQGALLGALTTRTH